MPSLSDKLKSLGVKMGSSLPASRPLQTVSHTIDSVVAGTFVPTPRGEAFVSEQAFDRDYLHGKISPYSDFPLSLISQWANDTRIADLPISKFAFLDTETSGISGGTGTYAFLVGAARFVDDKFVLQQFFLRDPSEEPAMLEALINFLAPCEGLVTFNGKAFDAPLLVTRYSLHRIPVPFKGYAHLDLLAAGKTLMARQAPLARIEISRRACAWLSRALRRKCPAMKFRGCILITCAPAMRVRWAACSITTPWMWLRWPLCWGTSANCWQTHTLDVWNMALISLRSESYSKTSVIGTKPPVCSSVD